MIASAVVLKIALLLSMKSDGQSCRHGVSLCAILIAHYSSRLSCIT